MCAGKEEDGGFSFTQEMIDDILAVFKDLLTGSIAQFFPAVPGYWFRPIVHLCISGASPPIHPDAYFCCQADD